MDSIRSEYRAKFGGYEDLAAIGLAQDLMAGDPATFKAGYTLENALLVVEQVFPDVALHDVERELRTMPAA